MDVFGDAGADSIQPAQQSGAAQSGHGTYEEFLLFGHRERTSGSRVTDNRAYGVKVPDVGDDSQDKLVIATV